MTGFTGLHWGWYLLPHVLSELQWCMIRSRITLKCCWWSWILDSRRMLLTLSSWRVDPGPALKYFRGQVPIPCARWTFVVRVASWPLTAWLACVQSLQTFFSTAVFLQIYHIQWWWYPVTRQRTWPWRKKRSEADIWAGSEHSCMHWGLGAS